MMMRNREDLKFVLASAVAPTPNCSLRRVFGVIVVARLHSERVFPLSTVVIGAHPDDEVLGPGGTIAKLAHGAGEKVFVIIVTDGSSTQYPGDEQKRRIKHDELERCCERLGVTDFIHGELPDMQLDTIAHTRINDFIAEHIARWKPHTIYTHFPDINRDHVRVFESSLVACRPTPSTTVKRVILFPTPSATEWDLPVLKQPFVPNEYVDIEPHIETKVKAFAAYGTETRDYPHPRSGEAIRATAHATGLKVGLTCAEEFVIARQIR